MVDRTPKRPRDPAQLAKLIVDIATGEVEEGTDDAEVINKRAAVDAGRKGGLQRAANTTPARKSEIGKAGAKARWATPPVPAEEE